MRLKANWLLPAVGLAVLLAACREGTQVSLTPSGPPPTATPLIGGQSQLRSALEVQDLLTRRDATLAAMGAYLADAEVKAMDDETASQHLTDLAFATGRIVIADRTFIRRAPGQPEIAVVGLPDGMGLVLYDLQATGQQPLIVARWTAGLTAVYATWRADASEVGVSYLTVGNDQQARAHFALATRAEDGWRVTWLADEERNWWLNAYAGDLQVAPELERITLTGTSDGTTLAFDEDVSGVRRTFRTVWQRSGDQYVLSNPPNADPEQYSAWLWSVAEPSPYTTLVEFLERLRAGDESGASLLAHSSVQALAAVQLELDDGVRRFTVYEQGEDTLVFGDERGIYQATFSSPGRPGDRWRMRDIRAVTAEDVAGEDDG